MRAALLVACALALLAWLRLRPNETPVTRWQDPVFAVPLDRPMPYMTLVTYRAALEAGLRWRVGCAVDAGESAERSPLATWTVRAGERAVAFTLRFRFDEPAGRLRAEAAGPQGHAELRSWPAQAKVDPVAAARDGLDDLPAAVRLLGLTLPPTPTAAGFALTAAAAGGFDELAQALLPLGQEPLRVTGAELARAARALAWQALLDARLAPVLAPLRSAQALALAEVADRRGLIGAAAEDVAVARWLAPPAAQGDFWVLGLRGPPDSAKELSPLSAAYVVYDMPRERPASWNLPFLVAFTERAVALDAAYAVPRLLTWSAGSRFFGLAARYVAMTGELGAVSRHALRCLRSPLAEAERAGVRGLPPLPRDLWRVLGRGGPEIADTLAPLAHFDFARVIAYARAVLDAAARAPGWPERLLLEETGEQLLAALAPVVDAMDHHRWLPSQRKLGADLAAACFDHPVINLLRLRLPREGDGPDEAVTLAQAARFPGVAARRPWQRGRDVSPARARQAQGALALFGAYPAAVFRAAQCLADEHGRHAATLLLDWLEVVHGARAPLAGDTVDLTRAERGWRAERLPVEARRSPAVAARVAERLRLRGQAVEARRLLADELALEPTAEAAVLELIRAGDLRAAREAVRAMSAAEPAGISWARAQLALAEASLIADRPAALLAARKAASSMDEDLILGHARVAAALGAEDDLESALSRLHLAGANADREHSIRAAAAVMGAVRRAHHGTSLAGPAVADALWDAVAAEPWPLDRALIGMMVRVMDASEVPLPAGHTRAALAARFAVARLLERAGPVTVAEVSAAARLMPADLAQRRDVRFPWGELIGMLLENPAADALPDAELARLAGSVEPLDGIDADFLLCRMAGAQVSAERLARTARRFAAMVPRPDAAPLAWAGASPQRARLWTAVLGHFGGPDDALEVARWLTLVGRVAEADALRGLVGPDDHAESIPPALLAPYGKQPP